VTVREAFRLMRRHDWESNPIGLIDLRRVLDASERQYLPDTVYVPTRFWAQYQQDKLRAMNLVSLIRQRVPA
jgi:hypothetical protein